MRSLMGGLHVARESRLARELREQCGGSEKRRPLLASLLHCGEIAAKPALCNSSEARSML